MSDSSYGSQIMDPVVARLTAVKKYTSRDAAWRERQALAEKRLEEEDADILKAQREILAIEARIMEARSLGQTKLDNVCFVPRTICAMPVKAHSWYEINTSWIRNPERMVLAAFEKGGRRIDFRERFGSSAQTSGFVVSISWD